MKSLLLEYHYIPWRINSLTGDEGELGLGMVLGLGSDLPERPGKSYPHSLQPVFLSPQYSMSVVLPVEIIYIH